MKAELPKVFWFEKQKLKNKKPQLFSPPPPMGGRGSKNTGGVYKKKKLSKRRRTERGEADA